MNEFKGFGDRLKSAIKDSGYSQKEISEILQINQDTITNYVKEKSLPKVDILFKLCNLLKISSDWLIFGVRDCDNESCIGNISDNDSINLTSTEKDMIFKFRNLDYEDQQDAMDIIDMKYNRKIKKEMSSNSTNGGTGEEAATNETA